MAQISELDDLEQFEEVYGENIEAPFSAKRRPKMTPKSAHF